MAEADIYLSIVVPVYNEAENLPRLYAEIEEAMRACRCKGQPCTWEALFIDDGSTDSSLAFLRELAQKHPNVRYVSFGANLGQSAAFAAGFKFMRGSIAVTMDADLQNDPADIPGMLNLYEQGYDVVAGWRARRQDTFVKRLSSKIANTVRNSLSRETIKDTGCSLKLMRASMVREVPMFKGMHRFFPTLMRMQGAQVAEMPVNHRPRAHGVSKYGVLDRAFAAFYDLLAIRWMQSRHFKYEIREKSS